MAYLVVGKILRSTETKFEEAENKLSLLLKNNEAAFIHLPYLLEKSEKVPKKFTSQN